MLSQRISHYKKCPKGSGQGVRLERNEEVLTQQKAEGRACQAEGTGCAKAPKEERDHCGAFYLKKEKKKENRYKTVIV